MAKTTFGVLIGNRGFFPGELAREGRRRILSALAAAGYGAVCLEEAAGTGPGAGDATTGAPAGELATRYGAVESHQEARRCAELFQRHRKTLDGIVISLPNFGDERAAADAMRLAGLDLPILVQAFPDQPEKMLMGHRRDSFCGKISVCNNLWQYGIRYSLTSSHTVAPEDPAFSADLARFAAVCRVVKGLRGLRMGVLGTRPAAFNTVRFSEKLLEREGITVEPLDLSEVLGRAARLADDAPAVKAKLEQIRAYVPTQGVPETALVKMAKFGTVVSEWMAANELAASSVQCWTAMEEFFGVVPCMLMSIMSEGLMSSACEADVAGALSMHVLQLAAGLPSAIVDWNNNYGGDEEKAVIFHCSNLPKHFFAEAKMGFQDIIATTLGKENTYGTIVGPLQAGPITYCRVSTDEFAGRMRFYAGEGEITPDRPKSFGGYGVVRIPGLAELLQYVCREGFEHHVAINASRHAAAVNEALGHYRGWAMRPAAARAEIPAPVRN
ncbi:MAG: L-fucose/L-arabinose isomerase family protein [Terriglobales bacterium]